ncbi:MAG: phosphotransferase, partial [Methanobrevibacter sp.]|nr:phosphotransferase [Methanobrevibacter sp.]
KCSCGGTIKKGVDFRISEIADLNEPIHPSFRPDYIHLMPLAEIISSVHDKGVTTKFVQGIWQKLIDNFRTEINVLINADLNDIEKIDVDIASAIESFRNGTVDIIPGGGGQYGQILFEKEVKKPKLVTLDNF